MLTDLLLHKYLNGRLSREEEKDLEGLMEKNPDLLRRLEELRERGHSVTRPAWERIFLDRGARRGSRGRYTTLLPAFLVLVLVLGIASHWFSKPGRNSTFLHAGGNGTAVDLLYRSPSGWRYLDAGFRTGDTLTIAVRDGGRYAARVFAVRDGLPGPAAEELWSSPEGRRYAQGDPKPAFASSTRGAPAPAFLAVTYDTASLAGFTPEDLMGFLRAGGSEGRHPGIRYQVIRIPETGSSSEATAR